MLYRAVVSPHSPRKRQSEVCRGQAGALYKLCDPSTSLTTSASVPSSVKKRSKTFPLRIVERNIEDQNSYDV